MKLFVVYGVATNAVNIFHVFGGAYFAASEKEALGKGLADAAERFPTLSYQAFADEISPSMILSAANIQKAKP